MSPFFRTQRLEWSSVETAPRGLWPATARRPAAGSLGCSRRVDALLRFLLRRNPFDRTQGEKRVVDGVVDAVELGLEAVEKLVQTVRQDLRHVGVIDCRP